MPPNNIDRVEIVEPPMGELAKRRSGLKRACFTSCASIVIFIIAILIALRLAIGPGPKILKNVPANFPPDILIYDKENIERITFISGKYKRRGVEIAAFFPKVILAPLLVALRHERGNLTENSALAEPKAYAANVWKLVTTPVTDSHDTIQIEWRKLDAEPSFIISYYKNQLRKQHYQIGGETRGQVIQQLSFSGASGVSGSLLAEGDEEAGPGTDYLVLTVNIP